MKLITLTSDLGTKDSYLASIKGAIYSELENVNIIDINNNIPPFDILSAAYVLRNCYKDFPIGTIHIISIDDELTISNEHLAVFSNGHYFLGADNGFFSLLFNEKKPELIFRIDMPLKSNSMTFAFKNVFVPAACHIARGGTLEIIGKKVDGFKVNKMELKPVTQNNIIRGAIIYVDNYGNATTNIKKEEFLKLKKDKRFMILFGREDNIINTISKQYNDVEMGEKLAIFGENNYLQISINKGMANRLLGLNIHETVRIEFI